MIIDCISDLHGSFPKLDGGDLLIVAGDLTARDEPYQHQNVLYWLGQQDYKKVIFIAGNHDGCYESKYYNLNYVNFLYEFGPKKTITYLQDSGCEFEGLKIWGSPWTPEFCNWHFMLPRHSDELQAKWDLIPNDTDILITHGPALGILDYTSPNKIGDRLGCNMLRKAVERVKPKLHVFGHIHGGYGQMLLKHEGPNTICVNAAYMDENYNPTNKPIRIEL